MSAFKKVITSTVQTLPPNATTQLQAIVIKLKHVLETDTRVYDILNNCNQAKTSISSNSSDALDMYNKCVNDWLNFVIITRK